MTVYDFAYVATLLSRLPASLQEAVRRGVRKSPAALGRKETSAATSPSRETKVRSKSAAFREDFLGRVPILPNGSPRVWFHGGSVGEILLLRPLVDALRDRLPDCRIAVSWSAITARTLALRTFPDALVFRCPWDYSWSVKNALRRISPDLLVIAEGAWHPNLVSAASQLSVATAVVNGRLDDDADPLTSWNRSWLNRAWKHIDLAIVQNEPYREKFRQIGIAPERIRVIRSLKFDGVSGDRSNPVTTRLVAEAGIAPEDTVFLAGSTQREDEVAALQAFSGLGEAYPRLRLIIVPRHMHRISEVVDLCRQHGHLPSLRSRLCSEERSWRVLIVDTLGELKGWWGRADVAFVGGGLGSRGGQNMLEPAAFGAATCFGPCIRNFSDIASALLEADGAQIVRDAAELAKFLERCLTDREHLQRLGANARSVVERNRGASTETIEALLPFLSAP